MPKKNERINVFILSFVLLAGVADAYADDHDPWVTAQIIEMSDLIFTGEVESGTKIFNIKVMETLKGSPPARIQAYPNFEATEKGLKERNPALFFATTREQGRIDLFDGECWQPIESATHVRDCLKALNDPGSIVTPSNTPPDKDYAYILGQLFGDVSLEYPSGFPLGPDLEKYLIWICSKNSRYEAHVINEINLHVDPQGEPYVRWRFTRNDIIESGIVTWIRDRWNSSVAQYFSSTNKSDIDIILRCISREKAGTLTRQGAVQYLRRCLEDTDCQTVERALIALQKMAARECIPDVTNLLSKPLKCKEAHPSTDVTLRALKYLAFFKDPQLRDDILNAVEHFSDVMYDRTGYESRDFIESVLMDLDSDQDPQAETILRKAAKSGFVRALSELGSTGGKEDFAVVLESARTHSYTINYLKCLCNMVKRSNLSVEEWMELADAPSYMGMEQEIKVLRHWQDWWKQHEKEFQIIK